MNEALWARAAGVLALVAIWLLLWALRGGRWTFKGLFDGADCRPSTSKFQFFLWTIVVIYAYVSIYAGRVLRGQTELISAMPTNLFVAMGLSIGTAVGAKAITAWAESRHPGTKGEAVDATDRGLSRLITDDAGNPDLAKTQVLAWTLVGVGAYLVTVWAQIDQSAGMLPDIDGTLMALMGLGGGAYLMAKLTAAVTQPGGASASASEGSPANSGGLNGTGPSVPVTAGGQRG